MQKTVGHWNLWNFKKLIYPMLSLFLAGCATPATYVEPITKFQLASTVVIETSRIEYGLVNKRERDAVIDSHVAKKQKITLQELNSNEIRIFLGEELAARMAALDALSKHGELLLALASHDAPTRAKDSANLLDDSIARLSSSLNDVPSDDFKTKASGFAAIAGEIANLALDKKISAALDKAIVSSEGSVTDLIKLIRNDMRNLHERRRVKISGERVDATDQYNKEVAKQNPNFEKLQNAASDIKKTEDSWDKLPLLLGAGPSLDAMSQAHLKLAAYAKSSKGPQDLAELAEAIDAFVVRAKVIADAIKAIRENKE